MSIMTAINGKRYRVVTKQLTHIEQAAATQKAIERILEQTQERLTALQKTPITERVDYIEVSEAEYKDSIMEILLPIPSSPPCSP
jgi:hypothetical protein